MGDEQVLSRRRQLGVTIARLYDAGDALSIQTVHDAAMGNDGVVSEQVNFEAGSLSSGVEGRRPILLWLGRTVGSRRANVADDQRRAQPRLLAAPARTETHAGHGSVRRSDGHHLLQQAYYAAGVLHFLIQRAG